MDEGRTDGAIAEALKRLAAGEIVAHPTEAVYGFGGLLEDRPLAALRRLKRRERAGFVILIADAAEVEGLLGDAGLALARAFWPGPLTLVVDDPDDRFHPGAKPPDRTAAVRVPGPSLTRRLLVRLGRPITSTSANRPGAPPARTAEAARREARAMGVRLHALDGGPLSGAAASALVRLDADAGPRLIRSGPIDAERLASVVGSPLPLPGAARSSADDGEPEPVHVVFVCTGNTCRSPMAEAIARRIVSERGWSGVTVASAGVAAWPGAPASEGARRVAAEDGLDLDAHASETLTSRTVADAGLVLCMDRGHLECARALAPSGRCALLSSAAGFGDEVKDPFGGGRAEYRAAFDELKGLVAAALDGLTARRRPAR